MLTELACKHAVPRTRPYKLSDAKGLHLLVQVTGSRLWRLAYRYGGKQKTLALGAYPQVNLAEARRARSAARDQLALGLDPSRRLSEACIQISDSFEQLAREHHAIWKSGKVAKHVNQVWARMERDVLPVIGSRPIDEITPGEILEMVRKVEARGAIEISKRLKQKCSEVFCYAIATGRARFDPTASISKALLPKPRVRHMAMVGRVGFAPLVEAVWAYKGDPAVETALRLTLLTAVRTSETRLARWEEFEFGEQPLWRIPAKRMKMSREHLIPLSAQACAELHRLGRRADGYVFSGRGGFGVICQSAMLMALRRSGFEGTQTVHGFRRLFSTLLNEGGWNRDWIERQLAHAGGDEVRGAYNAAEYLPDRRRMMQHWADLVRPPDAFEDLLG